MLSTHFFSVAVLDTEAELGWDTVTDECKEGIQGAGVRMSKSLTLVTMIRLQ